LLGIGHARATDRRTGRRGASS
jgi:hypothetical protein